jgi:peroxiredoxin Q/BCP
MTHLKEGDRAPKFEFTDHNGEKKSLDQFLGKKVILYFYPKDNTPGCTMEACNLRDNYKDLKDLGYEVIGVSADSEKSHNNFRSKYSLPFFLISDTEKKVLQDYGVWGEKKMMGRTYMGIRRLTFVIDEKGIIQKIFNKVKTKAHTEQILEEMKN